MKAIHLHEIITVIEGTIILGNSDIVVEYATIHPSLLKDNSVFFQMDQKETNWESISYDSIVVVTDRLTQLIEREQVGDNLTVIKVDSIEKAYWSFVDYYRNQFTLPIVGITGTCGKTTTTEMVKHILAQKMKFQSTEDGRNHLRNNLNYLMGIDETTKAAVIEMGVTHPGCIRYSSRYLKPTIGVILNIGVYHLLGCKTFENYVKAKSEMVEVLPKDGTLIINADDENIKKIDLQKCNGNVITFGIDNPSLYQASNVVMTEGGMSFELHYEQHKHNFFVPGVGVHNVYNALAATSVSHQLGIDIEESANRLKSFAHMRHHLHFRNGIKNSTIIDDTWNCTPLSVKTALEVLQECSNEKKKIAVIGYMPQLGDTAKSEYDRIAEMIVKMKIDYIVLIGEAGRIGIKATELGMEQKNIKYVNSGKDVYYSLLPHLGSQSLILFKFPYTFRLSKDASFQHLMKVMFV